MKLYEIYELAVRLGIEKDVRGQEEINRILEKNRREFERKTDQESTFFDRETLTNPFSDTRILYGTGQEEITSIFCGIDMEPPEIILADRLREKGRKIDLVMAHHPEGIAQAALFGVMELQAVLLLRAGIPINVAEGIMDSRISEVRRNMMSFNPQRAVEAARLLDIPFMCVHTPADNLVNDYLQRYIDDRNPCYLEELLEVLLEIPEYHEAKRLKAGPELVVGDKKKRAGRVLVDMTGGTSGSADMYEKLAAAGVGTVIRMHLTEKHREEARKHHINIVVAGHMASDSLGMNLFLDRLEQRGITIIPASGLIRHRRVQNHGNEGDSGNPGPDGQLGGVPGSDR